jgi:hypothetical protein
MRPSITCIPRTEPADERAAERPEVHAKRGLHALPGATTRRRMGSPAPWWPPLKPPQGPPKKKRTGLKIFLASAATFVLVLIAISAALNSHNNGTPAASSSPGPAASGSAAPASPAAAFQPQTLLDVSGSGQYQTARYTVGGSGDYDIDWTYNVGNDGPQVNFQIYGDGGSDFSVTDPNQLGSGGSGVIHVYNDSGAHYLQINSEGGWTVKVVTTP